MITNDHAFGVGALEMTGDGITELSRSIVGWLEAVGTDAEATLLLLDDIRARRVVLAEIEALVEAHAAKVMTGSRVVLTDGRVAERGPASRRTGWSHREVAFAVAADVVTDPITGEAIGDRQTAVKVAEALLSAAGISYWRGAELQRHGVDPDEYSEREKVRRTVRISTAKAVQR